MARRGAQRNDWQYGLYTNCTFPGCGKYLYAHGLPRHMQTHGVSVAFNSQGKCRQCGTFGKTTAYPESLCQSCWRPPNEGRDTSDGHS